MGYKVAASTGSIKIDGTSQNISVEYTKSGSCGGGSNNGSSGFLGLPDDLGYILLGVVVAVVAMIALFLLRKRKKKEERPNPPPSSAQPTSGLQPPTTAPAPTGPPPPP